ncbi:ABC transporter ATP-binding protein [Chloroflexota bacterium]
MTEKMNTSIGWAIEVQNLTKSFGYRRALRGLNLKVGKGEHLTIFGPNGAGKTTLLKVLSTLTKPSSGSVLVDGISLQDKPVEIRRRISLVSHHTFLYHELTVYENLKFYGRMYHVPDLDHRVHEVVSLVGLEARLHDRVGTLSRGLQQRASLARAVLHNPSIVLLDEPETGLDPHAIRTMKSMLVGNGNHEERTVIVTSHNLDWGLEVSDSVAILNTGEIVYQAGRPEIDTQGFPEIYDHYTGTRK